MRTIPRQSGSSLLLTLLIMIGVSGIILTVAKSVAGQARLTSQTKLSHEADQMALTGIDDGLMRINRGQTNIDQQYGDDTLGLNRLGPLRVGFTGAACDTVADVSPPSTALNDPTCPYYDLAVRSQTSVSEPTEALLTPLDLVLGQTQTFRVLSTPGSVLLVPHFVNPNGSSITCDSGCATPGPFVDGSQIQVTAGPSNNFSLTLTSGELSTKGVSLYSSITPSEFVIFKTNSFLIQATGYSGGVQKKYILFRNDITNKQQLIDFTGTISEKGVITY
jgi:hypothetical protein